MAKVLLSSKSIHNLRKEIANRQFLPIEIIKTKRSGSVVGNKDREMSCEHHGVAYVNLIPLLYPGTTKVSGAYRVVPFNEEECVAKTKFKKSVLSDSSSTEMKGLPTPQAIQKKPMQKPDRKTLQQGVRGATDELGRTLEEKGRETVKTETAASAPASNREAQQYLEAQTFIVLKIEIERPLVAKRTVEEVNQSIRSYITAKEVKPTPIESAAKAVSDYHKSIAEVARYISVEIKEIFADLIQKDQVPVDSESVQKMKSELFYSINSKGRYFAFKERLKYAVIKIVREKMFRTLPFSDDAQMQSFLSDLYVFLIDEMHIGLRKVFNMRQKAPSSDEMHISNELLLRMARESRSIGDSEWSSRYYGELVARDPSCSAYWIEFASLYLSTGEPEKAEVCLHRVLRTDQSHPTALLLCGLIAAMQERVEEATNYLESAVMHDESNPVAWIMMGCPQ
ncbi:unnamed protein product [Dicrocoelium dendriticum]|nr:unnamed protein product [Dicrocoelium dendriticum]